MADSVQERLYFLERIASGQWYPLVHGAHQAGRTLRTDGWMPDSLIPEGWRFTLNQYPQEYRVANSTRSDEEGRADIWITPDLEPQAVIDNQMLISVSGRLRDTDQWTAEELAERRRLRPTLTRRVEQQMLDMIRMVPFPAWTEPW